jgi:replicative DNA helicase
VIDREAGDAAALLQAIAADGARPDSVATGFPSLDAALGGGMRRGDLIALGGEVGSGKSALALAVALRAGERGARTAFATGEMHVERVLERAVAIEGRVRMEDLRRPAPDEGTRRARADAASRLARQLPHIVSLAPDGLDALDALLSSTAPVQLLIVDPIQALAAAQPLQEEVARIARALKSLALRHDVAILVTSHLHAMPRDRADRRPQLEDFGALGALSQHADVVLGLFREEMHDTSHGIEGATELLVLKQRDGTLGYVDLYFYAQWLRFEDVVEPDR